MYGLVMKLIFCYAYKLTKRNICFLGTEAPDKLFQKPLCFTKCTAWITISKHGIIGPVWFEDEKGKATTVTKEPYIEVFKKFYTRLNLLKNKTQSARKIKFSCLKIYSIINLKNARSKKKGKNI